MPHIRNLLAHIIGECVYAERLDNIHAYVEATLSPYPLDHPLHGVGLDIATLASGGEL